MSKIFKARTEGALSSRKNRNFQLKKKGCQKCRFNVAIKMGFTKSRRMIKVL